MTDPVTVERMLEVANDCDGEDRLILEKEAIALRWGAGEIVRLRADNERLTQLVKELHKSDGELRAEIGTLRQIVVDYTYATSYLAPESENLLKVRMAAGEAIPDLIGNKVKPSWER